MYHCVIPSDLLSKKIIGFLVRDWGSIGVPLSVHINNSSLVVISNAKKQDSNAYINVDFIVQG